MVQIGVILVFLFEEFKFKRGYLSLFIFVADLDRE